MIIAFKVLTDSGGRMIPEELDKSIEAVKASGNFQLPCLQAGLGMEKISEELFRSRTRGRT